MTRTLVETVAEFKSQIVEKNDAIEELQEKVQQLERELREKVQAFDQGHKDQVHGAQTC